MKTSFEFLKCIKWKAIFDFDSESTMCNLAQRQLGMALKIIQIEDFDPHSPANAHQPDRLKSLHDDIKTSVYPSWIFVNGYGRVDKAALSTYEWKRERQAALKESIQFFGREIPQGRAVVMFALLSKDYEIMLESADDFSSTFKDQWMAIAETDNIGGPWMKEMYRRHCTNSEERQIVTGMLWEQVNDTIKHLCGPHRIGDCELPSSTGAFVELKESVKADLSDLEILSSTECDNADIINNEKELEKLKYGEEHNFYKGGEVSWWNFWFPNHVLQRENLGKLRNLAAGKLKGNQTDEYVRSVFLYHEPRGWWHNNGKKCTMGLTQRL